MVEGSSPSVGAFINLRFHSAPSLPTLARFLVCAPRGSFARFFKNICKCFKMLENQELGGSEEQKQERCARKKKKKKKKKKTFFAGQNVFLKKKKKKKKKK